MEPDSVENIVLFVGGSVRFDASVDQLMGIGQSYKSGAASLHTPVLFGSILAGMNVPARGITGLQNILPDAIPSFFDLVDINTAFSNKTGTIHEELHRISVLSQGHLLKISNPIYLGCYTVGRRN